MSYTITTDKNIWETVIGLEVHCQVLSRSKIFSTASATFGSEANSNITLLDVAMPGTLPVINEFCIEQAVKTGLGINGNVNKVSVFDRKNYFYPDSPSGYQITQFYKPILGLPIALALQSLRQTQNYPLNI